jgi:hypothetical protein
MIISKEREEDKKMYFEVKENENEPVYLTKVSLYHGVIMLLCNYDFYKFVPWWRVKKV